MRRIGFPQRGFTLIELLIAVVVAAVLAALAVPSYLDSLRSARRTDAHTILLKAQLDQEKYRGNNTSYAASTAALGWASANSADGYYTVAFSGVGATAYTATATAESGTSQAGDSGCTAIVLSQSAGNTTTTPAACWKK